MYIMFWLVIPIVLGIISYLFYKKSRKLSTNSPQYDHAIIIGGSIGGMVTATYLTKYFSRITIIESDDVLSDRWMNATPSEILDYRCRLESPTSLGRSGVSQMYQSHVVQGEGHRILCELFPHLNDKLINEYHVDKCSLKTQSRFIVNNLLLHQNLTDDIELLGVDRFTLETVLRQELCLKFGNQIEWKCNSRVIQLLVDKSLNLVKGIKYKCKKDIGASPIDMYGDFIIDCSGRNSSSTKWLKENFNLNIPTVEIQFGSGYVTFIGERLKTGDPSLDLKSIMIYTTNSPINNTGYGIMPIRTIEKTEENSLGTLSTITANCVNSEFPPNDSFENLLEWAKDNLDTGFYSLLKATKVHSPLIPYRRANDVRKYVESLGRKWPRNYILLGDAMCTFNPQYGQGITHACRHARELEKIFAENYYTLHDISYIYNRRASAISDECWLLSTMGDWKTPTIKIIKTDQNGETKTYQRDENSTSNSSFQAQTPLMIRFIQWYSNWFVQCASTSGSLSSDFAHVGSQLKSPFILFRPTTILAVCYRILMNYLNLSKKSSVV